MSKVDSFEALKMRIDGFTLQEIADSFGVTKQYIHQLFNSLLKENKTGIAKCIYPGLKAWFISTGTTVGEMNKKLALCNNNNLLYNRLRGKTPFTLPEIKVLLQYTGLTFEEAFGKETNDEKE